MLPKNAAAPWRTAQQAREMCQVGVFYDATVEESLKRTALLPTAAAASKAICARLRKAVSAALAETAQGQLDIRNIQKPVSGLSSWLSLKTSPQLYWIDF